MLAAGKTLPRRELSSLSCPLHLILRVVRFVILLTLNCSFTWWTSCCFFRTAAEKSFNIIIRDALSAYSTSDSLAPQIAAGLLLAQNVAFSLSDTRVQGCDFVSAGTKPFQHWVNLFVGGGFRTFHRPVGVHLTQYCHRPYLQSCPKTADSRLVWRKVKVFVRAVCIHTPPRDSQPLQ